ncbi:transposase [Candidatus Roizmanbacteria bacterium]|nr:transposase [Candidatus Roizmanbacteria bacterium]
MTRPIEQKLEAVAAFLRKEVAISKACERLSCTPRTFLNYRKRFLKDGIDGLKDERGGNNRKLTQEQVEKITDLKIKDPWRSSRNIRDKLKLPVSIRAVGKILKKAGLVKVNIKRLKPIQTFEASSPNEMWQTDIMGKIIFPRIGALYLTATLDDHSRFVPYAEWFASQHKANVFIVWYYSLLIAGIPNKMLQDRGSQYKANSKIGEADYQFYAAKLAIELVFAKRAQTKGKIEKFWQFVQKDFVPEVINAENKQEVNEKFKEWLHWYNYEFKSEYFEGKTHSSKWYPAKRKPGKEELDEILTVWERRRVTKFNTVSLYGVWCKLPPGYMLCRVWLKIIGDTIYFQSMNRIFHKSKLRLK